MTLRQILERRETIRTEMHAIHAAHPDVLPADAERRWKALQDELDAIGAQERRQAALDDLDRRAMGKPVTPAPMAADPDDSGDPLFDGLVTALDVVRAQMGATDSAAGRAREVSQELARRSGRPPEGLYFHMGMSGARAPERRVFTTTNPSGGPGSNLIQTTVSPNVIDRLRERLVVRQMGATVLSGLVGNLSIPRLKASATAAWVAESGALTASDPQTDQVSFTPKHCGGIVELSRNMIQQSSSDVARLMENDLAQILAVALDQVAIQGGGTNQPSGLLASGSGIGSVAGGTNGAALTWANIIALISAVDQSNALGGSLGFVTNAKVVKSARTTAKTATDTASNFIMDGPNSLAGYGLLSTQNTPSNLTKGTGTGLSALIFGDWSQLFLGFWSELDILVNPYESTAYSKGNVQVRAMMTADVRIRQPGAFAAITDIIAP